MDTPRETGRVKRIEKDRERGIDKTGRQNDSKKDIGREMKRGRDGEKVREKERE